IPKGRTISGRERGRRRAGRGQHTGNEETAEGEEETGKLIRERALRGMSIRCHILLVAPSTTSLSALGSGDACGAVTGTVLRIGSTTRSRAVAPPAVVRQCRRVGAPRALAG